MRVVLIDRYADRGDLRRFERLVPVEEHRVARRSAAQSLEGAEAAEVYRDLPTIAQG